MLKEVIINHIGSQSCGRKIPLSILVTTSGLTQSWSKNVQISKDHQKPESSTIELVEWLNNRNKFIFHPLNDHMTYSPVLKYHEFDSITSKHMLKAISSSKLTIDGLISKLVGNSKINLTENSLKQILKIRVETKLTGVGKKAPKVDLAKAKELLKKRDQKEQDKASEPGDGANDKNQGIFTLSYCYILYNF